MIGGASTRTPPRRRLQIKTRRGSRVHGHAREQIEERTLTGQLGHGSFFRRKFALTRRRTSACSRSRPRSHSVALPRSSRSNSTLSKKSSQHLDHVKRRESGSPLMTHRQIDISGVRIEPEHLGLEPRTWAPAYELPIGRARTRRRPRPVRAHALRTGCALTLIAARPMLRA